MNAARGTAHGIPADLPWPCAADPDRWLEAGDDPELKALCRACPRRFPCAKDALNTPAAVGMWSAVYLPPDGRARQFALRQLRSLVAHAEATG